MKILYIGVFDKNFKSTNTSQLLSLQRAGAQVAGYNYKDKAATLGFIERDRDLVNLVRERSFDLVLYSKCNLLSYDVFENIKQQTKTALWFMDPLQTYDNEMREKTKLVDYFYCDKNNVLREALKINPNSHRICEGYNENVDRPIEGIEKEYDVSFIGAIYGDRMKYISSIKPPVKIITNAYGKEHAVSVAKSRINLNLCTTRGASDRVYKVLAAGGFLITDDWDGREEDFVDGKDLVVFKNIEDLNQKINYYLTNPEVIDKIAQKGKEVVQKFTRLNWAKEIMRLTLSN
jgi:hypothetical protein